MAEYDAFLAVYADAFGDRLRARPGQPRVMALGSRSPTSRCRSRDLPGARIVLLDTSVDGAENGAVRPAQLDELDEIAATSDRPVLLFGHHHVWDPGSAERPERYFGIVPDDSERLVELVARRPVDHRLLRRPHPPEPRAALRRPPARCRGSRSPA